MLKLQRHAVGIPQHRHALPVVDVDMLHRAVQGLERGLLQLRRRLPRREFGRGEDLVGRLSPHAGEGRREKLPQAAGIAFAGQFRERLERDFLDRWPAAVGERRLDHEGIAAVNRGRPRGGGEKLAWHHLPQPGQQPLLADRYHAVGGRWRDFRLLDRLVEGIGLAAAELARRHAGGEFRQVAESLGRAVRDAGERLC